VAGTGAVLGLASIAPMLGDWPPTRLRYEIESTMRGERFSGSGVSSDLVLVWLRRLLLVAVGGCVAALVLAMHAARRNNAARIGLTVVLPITAIASFAAGVVGLLLAVAAIYSGVLLWSRDAGVWFLRPSVQAPTRAGPVPPPPRIPAHHSSKERPDTMSTQPPQHEGSAPGQSGPGQSDPGSAYPGSSQSGPTYPGPSYPPPPPQPYGGQGGYGGGYGGSPVPRGRPGTVTAAAITTIVMAALTGLGWALIGIAFAVGRDALESRLVEDPQFEAFDVSQEDVDTFASALIGISIGAVIICALAIAMSILVLKGRNWARIVLVLLSAITVVISLVMLLGGGFIALLWLVAAGAVIGLLFAGGAGAWFDTRAHNADAGSQY